MASEQGSGNNGEEPHFPDNVDAAPFEQFGAQYDGGEQQAAEEEVADQGDANTTNGTGSSWEHVPENAAAFDPWGAAAADPNRGRTSQESQWNYDWNYDDQGQGAWDQWNDQQSYAYAQSGISLSRDPRARADDHGAGLKPGDVPPTWDGKEPQKYVRPYIKSLNAWIAMTRTQKTARGYVLLHAARGDLKELFDALEHEDLIDESCPQKMLDLVKVMYGQFLKRPIPELVENALFDHEKTFRKANEHMMVYIMRKTRYWN